MVDDARRWRQLTVWLHVVTSVGWMTLALVLFVLLSLALTAGGGPTAAAATAMAHHLDVVLLAPLANTSAATGLVLSLGTPWGWRSTGGSSVGFPLPALSLLSVVVAAEARRRRLRDDRSAAARSAIYEAGSA